VQPPQFTNQPQDVSEELSRDSDFGHLEGDIAAWQLNFAMFPLPQTFRLPDMLQVY
jgi:hypothetical protein